jgi:phosphotransferase system IIB component
LDATLFLILEINGVVQSKNAYEIVIGTHSWAMEGQK